MLGPPGAGPRVSCVDTSIARGAGRQHDSLERVGVPRGRTSGNTTPQHEPTGVLVADSTLGALTP